MKIQGNYPHFEQSLAVKKTSVTSKKTAEAGRFLANAVPEQQGSKNWKLVLSRNLRIRKQTIFPESRVFSIKILNKNSIKVLVCGKFHATAKSNRHWHARSNFLVNESPKISQRTKTIEKNYSLYKEYFGQATYLRVNVPWNAPICLYRPSRGNTQRSSLLLLKQPHESLCNFRQM